MTATSSKDGHRSQPSAAIRLARVRRLGGYAFWTGTAVMVPIGLDRLVIFPVLNRHLGEEVFGAFVWVLGVVTLFSRNASTGFVITLLRDMAQHSRKSAGLLLRTAFLLCLGVSILVLLVTTLASYPLAGAVVQARAPALYIPLYGYAVLFGLEAILITGLRVERRFATIFVLKMIEGVLLLGNLLVAPSRSVWAIGAVYMVSVLIVIPVAMTVSPHVTVRGRWWDGPSAKWLGLRWFGGAWINFTEQSQLFAARIVLGVLSTGADVTILVAGTSIGSMFVFPMGMLGTLVLSLLAGRKTFALSGRRGLVYLLVVLVSALIVGAASYLIGRWLILHLYPNVAAKTLDFYHWIAVANVGRAVSVMMRPVAVRYGALRWVAALSAVGMAVQMALLAVMVPIDRARGAAIALAISALVAMCMWLAAYRFLCRRAAPGEVSALHENADVGTQ